MSLLSRESSQPLTEQLAQRFVARMRDQLALIKEQVFGSAGSAAVLPLVGKGG